MSLQVRTEAAIGFQTDKNGGKQDATREVGASSLAVPTSLYVSLCLPLLGQQRRGGGPGFALMPPKAGSQQQDT